MNILIICAVFIVFLVLIHGFLYYKKKCSTLLNAVFAADQLKKDLVLRDKNRSKEFDFVVAQTKGLVSNISEQLYSGGLTVQSFKQQHHAEIGFVSDVLRQTPAQFIAHKIGHADVIEGEGANKNLQELIAISPEITELHYIELILVVRSMLISKIDLDTAVKRINSGE
ncbi:hypothetical protein [Pseudoalteromonas marina]|uniref:Uncharacterized protein n=1 Tax=Pseudoalteromonas marina TaxID=267375 RepID=A0ABT9FGG6_9GAMM|nr:hypothetical protein [Pseudoalteromonas marina]MDP2565877.1 hypothetical protein [Pseudoalteromonas marina]